MKQALEIELVEEAEGFELHIVDGDGERHAFNVHICAFSLVGIGASVREHFAGGLQAAIEHERDLATQAYYQERDEHLVGLGEIDGGGD